MSKKTGGTSAFLISFLLPVSEHCAPAVSIATPTDGGPTFKAKVEWMVAVVVVMFWVWGGRGYGGVKVQGQVVAVMK